jgi:hypothetical protein
MTSIKLVVSDVDGTGTTMRLTDAARTAVEKLPRQASATAAPSRPSVGMDF